ncbi:multiple epidermal growth factor-like domains protein 11 [Haliotis cracherodii]|uniref:multiple epidermal growth factor-like domains protein 11 n=1 Tax=Haliotis cracherodii TaxID=6455 RepID=UPI0039EC0C7E
MGYTVYLYAVVLGCVVWRASLDERRCANGRFGNNCIYQCHCLKDTNCDDVTGNCSSGCAEGWSGNACQRRNIVFNMAASISGNVAEGGVTTDGDVTTCISSRPNRTGRWIVDLLVKQTVHSMRIRAGNVSVRSWGVYVGDFEDSLFWSVPCTTLRYDGTGTSFTCDKPVAGRYVGIMNLHKLITVCEVEIFTCADFTFGKQDCNSRCRCFETLEVCDHVFGTCRTGCQPGWAGSDCQQACNGTYGRNCVHRCGRCRGGEACDTTTGKCRHGCETGWTGPTCHAKCPVGSYGDNCSEACSHCLEGSTCFPTNGTCVKGCAARWKGPKCDRSCDFGEYGDNCALRCSHCVSSTGCDSRNGRCQAGCEPGWEGVFCTVECMPGRFGPDCKQTCGRCLQAPCDRRNGSCGEGGCLQGWSGDICDQACATGYYGENCDFKCGNCADDVECDLMNGTCFSACKHGWYGDKCDQTCLDGTWGGNCSETCGLCHQNKACNPETGLCDEGCFVGYSGTHCDKAKGFRDLSSALVMPVMVVSASIVCCNLCLLFTCLVFKWRRDEKQIPRPGTNTEALLTPQAE